jgi:hypothetical protein
MGPDCGNRKFESLNEFHGSDITAGESFWLHCAVQKKAEGRSSSSEFKLQLAFSRKMQPKG